MPTDKQPTSVPVVMTLTVLVGAVIGSVVGMLGFPDYVGPFALLGALSAGAVAVARMVFRNG